MESLIGDLLKEVASLGALTTFQYVVAVFVMAFVIMVIKKMPKVDPIDPEKSSNPAPPMDMPEGGMPVPPPDHDYSKDP